LTRALTWSLVLQSVGIAAEIFLIYSHVACGPSIRKIILQAKVNLISQSTVAVNPIISSTCLMHARYLDSSAQYRLEYFITCVIFSANRTTAIGANAFLR
jgi:hypothetical protein